jgi:hypothetical protein
MTSTIQTNCIRIRCFESFPFREKLLFSSAKPCDFDGTLGTGLPVSMYTTTGSPVPNVPSKSHGLADENKSFSRNGNDSKQRILMQFVWVVGFQVFCQMVEQFPPL